MRVINTSTFTITTDNHSLFVDRGYAILSHRWTGAEIEYQGFPHHIAALRSNLDSLDLLKPIGLNKIRDACRIARRKNIRWMWIDTCCIDKSNAVEYNESINSMYRWYACATICITYLSDVKMDPNSQGVDIFRSSEHKDRPSTSTWFSRGWTLQELLAPVDMEFYDTDWELIGTRKSLAAPLEEITQIKRDYFTGASDCQEASIAAKISWMAGRVTEKPEDVAYSMLGLLGINMVPSYGEGAERAFLRLQYALLSESTDETLFAWKMPTGGPGKPAQKPRVYGEHQLARGEWGLLATSPEWFRHSGNITNRGPRGRIIRRQFGGFAVVQQGIMVPYSQSSYVEHRRAGHYILSCPIFFTVIGIIPLLIYDKYFGWKPVMRFALNAWEPDEKGHLSMVEVAVWPTQWGSLRITDYFYNRRQENELPMPYGK
ncbi:HET-domain-containing protein [Xylariaceae sp. FL1019]|nr:HET-domain-containing protein [Xylariaceae sp. FL1019]